jgi:hypothetical protein
LNRAEDPGFSALPPLLRQM